MDIWSSSLKYSLHTYIFYIRYAIKQASKGKSIRHDDIPTEVLDNDSCVLHLATCTCKLFNVRFQTGVIPESWSRGIINPIPKNLYCVSPFTLVAIISSVVFASSSMVSVEPTNNNDLH